MIYKNNRNSLNHFFIPMHVYAYIKNIRILGKQKAK